MGAVRATTILFGALAIGLTCCGGGGGGASDLGHPPTKCSTMAVNAGVTAEMEPGGDCIACHAKGGAPALLIGGTVMNALHDDTNCAGVAGITVRLTGADGQMLEMVTNATGNFYTLASEGKTLALPFNAELVQGTKSVKMLTAQMDTNCMSCHTAMGAKLAVGRIIAPMP
jgi:hypothetical protein